MNPIETLKELGYEATIEPVSQNIKSKNPTLQHLCNIDIANFLLLISFSIPPDKIPPERLLSLVDWAEKWADFNHLIGIGFVLSPSIQKDYEALLSSKGFVKSGDEEWEFVLTRPYIGVTFYREKNLGELEAEWKTFNQAITACEKRYSSLLVLCKPTIAKLSFQVKMYAFGKEFTLNYAFKEKENRRVSIGRTEKQFSSRDELKQNLFTLLDRIEETQTLRNTLSTPYLHYRYYIGDLLITEAGNRLHSLLLGFYTEDEIESIAREGNKITKKTASFLYVFNYYIVHLPGFGRYWIWNDKQDRHVFIEDTDKEEAKERAERFTEFSFPVDNIRFQKLFT